MCSHFAQCSDLLLYYLVQYVPGQRANGGQFGEGRLSLAAIVILIAFRLPHVCMCICIYLIMKVRKSDSSLYYLQGVQADQMQASGTSKIKTLVCALR
jgi:hypothetical protein